jgi:hypothetical protein
MVDLSHRPFPGDDAKDSLFGVIFSALFGAARDG